MKKNNIVLMIVTILTFLVLIIGATYAFFSTGNMNITNVANANTVTERNNMVFVTLGGNMSLDITVASMQKANSNNVAAENSTTLTVNFTPNTDYNMVCTYDIVYEWTSSDKYTAHTSGVTANEYTIQGILASNAHAGDGTNYIYIERDLSVFSYTNNSTTVVSGATIDGTSSTTTTAVWTLTSKFYNVNQDQSALSGKTYSGKFKVANVSCSAGTAIIIAHLLPDTPVDYWYSTSSYYFPNHPGSVEDSGPDTGYFVYIGQNSTQYFVCGTYTTERLDDWGVSYAFEGNSIEICLSQPYTQYGLTGHGSNLFTEEEQKRIILSLGQVFIDSGILISPIQRCHCNRNRISCECTIAGLEYYIHYSGLLNIVDWDENEDGDIECYLNTSREAYC